ncbi:MAG: long-chain-fatty-acid--CoA ligase [Candidatus Lokiarchaeota archaeon]|nr:long-chain-fatty-acid--CoA ligase [Candidatus Lokiarchaeota archaeon]
MKVVKGFPADPEGTYQLKVINLMKHAIRNFARQEIVSRKMDGTLFRYTYGESYERMQRLANALQSIGIKVGDRVGVLAWNHHQHYEIYFGLPGTGAVMVSLNLRLTPQDLSYVVNHSGTKYIIVDEDLINVAESIAPLCKKLKGYIIITEKDLSEIITQLKPVYSYEKLLSKALAVYNWPNLDENSAYAACYTTGTTGKPKGVYYSHRNVYIQAMMFAAQLPMSLNDVVFQLVPMFHVLGWSKPQAATYAGAKLIFSGRWNLDDLEELTDVMVQEKVTVSGAVPAVFMAMLEFIRKMENKPDLSGTRLICGGSEPPIALMRGFWEECGGEIIHSYGSTEAMAITTLNFFKPWLKKELSEDNLWNLKKKQGTIVSGLDVKIVDEHGDELPHDGKLSGEILLRGPWITRSYYNAPETKENFTEDGFFKSGDAGSLDSEGYLKITDRIKDVIKSGGEWISSIDMENALVSHPVVLEAAVVGIPHPKWDERPLVLIVLREGCESTSKDEIREHLSKVFAKWQLPNEILFVDSIPRTSVGKLNKKAIRMEYKNLYIKNQK